MSGFVQKRAIALWEEGQRHHIRGDIERALELYSLSISIFPTAEAHTFRGWALSAQKKLDEAIAECKRAIEVDPSFGNPYNDIGSYLLAQGKLDEAIQWLDEAKKAPRYEPRHFPYMNLGRVYAAKGMLLRSIREFEGALELCPNDPVCIAALDELYRAVN